jgi:hypothetical protein
MTQQEPAAFHPSQPLKPIYSAVNNKENERKKRKKTPAWVLDLQ